MEVDSGRDDRFVVVRKLNGGVLKIGDVQDKVTGKIDSDDGENNEFVGNGVNDRYKQDRRLLTLASNWCKKNSWVDICHNGTAAWMAIIAEEKGLESDKSHRQNRKIFQMKWCD